MKYPRITSALIATTIALSGATAAIDAAPSAGAAAPAVTASLPTFTAQPKSTTAYVGATAQFNSIASGTSLTYRWQIKIAGGTWAPVNGAINPTLRVAAIQSWNKAQFRVIVRGSGGQAISQAATLTVITPRPVIEISGQPHSTSVTAGHVAGFHVSASGYRVSYQWQRKPTGGTWQNLSGATGTSISLTARTANNGYQFRVLALNAGGTKASSAATLTVASTRTDPVKAGVSARLTNWQAKVEPTNTNAWTHIHQWDPTVPGPAANDRYVLAHVDILYVGSASSDPFYDLDVEFVGGDGRVYSDTDKFYWSNSLLWVGEMFHNATAQFATIVEIPTTAVAGGKWRITDHSATWPGTVAWFGLS